MAQRKLPPKDSEQGQEIIRRYLADNPNLWQELGYANRAAFTHAMARTYGIKISELPIEARLSDPQITVTPAPEIKIKPLFPSSKLCRFCGCINDGLTLADRTWTCDCGAVLERDRNAALNIERQALKMLAGVGSRTTETHAEQMSDPSGQSAMKQ